MVSKLSKRIEEFELRLKRQGDSEQELSESPQRASHKTVLELTSFVHELSRKIDQQQGITP
jgi:hypothetical protein